MAGDSDALLSSLLEEAKAPAEEVSVLSERELWDRHGPAVWRAERFEGSPTFYPVYRYRDLYSYSPLSLILRKGVLRLDARVAARVARPEGWIYLSSDGPLDREVRRVGGPPRPRFEIASPRAYAEAVAGAMMPSTSRGGTRAP